MANGNIPVIVGAGQITDVSTPPDRARGPMDLMADAARAAVRDAFGAATNDPGGQAAGGAEKWREAIRAVESITVIRMFSDSTPRFRSPFGQVANPPWSLARRLGSTPREMVYTPGGGNMPQVALARACDQIAGGECAAALLAGGEALRTELAAKRAGLALDWSQDAPSAPEEWGGHRYGFSEHERLHGIAAAIHIYPLFEQAIRGALGRLPGEHQLAMGRLFARFAAVARANPLATRRNGYPAEEIAAATPANPYIGYPYTKLMTANAYVDQAAALLVCSSAKADEWGIAPERRVYLHGHAEANDHWYVSERADLHSSPAIRSVARAVLEMADRRLADVSVFDLYSCFPSAVEIACREMGLAEDDPRDLTVTGGLPFFGGPGNNYAMHAIAEMVERMRRSPGAFGLVTANGFYVTKHAAGLFSTAPLEEWRRRGEGALQREIDALPKARYTENPHGPAAIESYAVAHGKSGPERGIVVGRLLEDGVRFVANTPAEAAVFARLESEDCLGLRGAVRTAGGRSEFQISGGP